MSDAIKKKKSIGIVWFLIFRPPSFILKKLISF